MSDERVRLFVALELPVIVRSELERWREAPVRGGGLRPVAAEALHVTLCFLGWRSWGEVEAIGDACVEASLSQPPPRLRLSGPLWLPPPRPRLLAVALEDLSGGLLAVQSRLSQVLAAGGWYTPEKRPFLAHVTVARARRDARIRAADLSPPSSLEFHGGWVTLYRSRLSPGGARYEPLRRVEVG